MAVTSKQQILDMHARGDSITEICAELGRTKALVEKTIREEKERVDREIEQVLGFGFSQKYAADNLGVTRARVQKVAKAIRDRSVVASLSKPKDQKPAKNKPPAAPVVEWPFPTTSENTAAHMSAELIRKANEISDLHANIDDLRDEIAAGNASIAARDKRIEDLGKQLKELGNELETERMRLAGCGVLAYCNTPDSLAKNREMHPDYMCASVSSVITAMEREIKLNGENAALKARITALQELVEMARPSGQNAPAPAAADSAFRVTANQVAEMLVKLASGVAAGGEQDEYRAFCFATNVMERIETYFSQD